VQTALSSGNLIHLKDAAHSLKSTSGTMGAITVHEASQQLETAAKQGDLDRAAHWLPVVEREHERAIAALSALEVAPLM
jgi:HPt (histidine-containing phosphotransfer) domain-containing protein